jgi:hypothetical protein
MIGRRDSIVVTGIGGERATGAGAPDLCGCGALTEVNVVSTSQQYPAALTLNFLPAYCFSDALTAVDAFRTPSDFDIVLRRSRLFIPV